MARVTVEDCIDKVENRFDLVLLASHRARMISSGAPITVERDNDKNPVVALARDRRADDRARRFARGAGPLLAEICRGGRAGAGDRSAHWRSSAAAGVDADDTEVIAERMTEEELLKGLEGLTPAGGAARRGGVSLLVFGLLSRRPGARFPGRSLFGNQLIPPWPHQRNRHDILPDRRPRLELPAQGRHGSLANRSAPPEKPGTGQGAAGARPQYGLASL